MDTASVSKLKDNLSAHLRPDRLALLLALGLVQPPVGALPIKRPRQALRPLPRKSELAAALREDRDDDR